MKMRVLLALSICCASLVAVHAENRPETGIAGKWVTDAVSNAKPDVKSKSTISRIIDTASSTATQRIPGTTSRGPGGGPGGRGGNVRVDTSPATVVEKGSSPDGAALILELKVEKSKLTGKVTEVVSGVSQDIEEGRVMGAKFEFTTYKKVLNVKTPTIHRGELTDETTIVLTRSLSSGKAVDQKEDGSPAPLMFKRVK